jgi:type II secretory ATPase GspE/PulE/Tfp pilus assembly ATPase PilB-like protein
MNPKQQEVFVGMYEEGIWLTGLGKMLTGGILSSMDAIRQGEELSFSLTKVFFFVGWFCLCLYSVKRSDDSPLVTDQYRYLSNLGALIVGPLALFVLFVADVVKQIYHGQMTLLEVPKYTLDAVMSQPARVKARVSAKVPEIELLDTAGRRFADVYSRQNQDHSETQQVARYTEQMVLTAIQGRASDILIDPQGDSTYLIRFRIDGFLRQHEQLDAKRCNAVINSLKAISGMDIAEKRRPQDGAFMAKLPNGQVYFRMASSGVIGGEKLAVRVLDQTRGVMTLPEIGFTPDQVKTLTGIIEQPQGMVLICGPTGSGKTTTLYAMLNKINFGERNVVSIEDPIEHAFNGISQIEVNTKAGVTFAASLRSILRQDPDVICIGEIRDAETAGIAIQAAQTGHLVMATLHASSNMAAIVRLMDLGVRPLLLASALNIIISQRLIRQLCEYCKGPAELSQSQMEYCAQNNLNATQILQAKGCGICGGTGYYGRTAIMDIMYMNDHIRTVLCNNTLTPGDLKQKGDKQFHTTLRLMGMKKVITGMTTLSEVKRVVSSLE